MKRIKLWSCLCLSFLLMTGCGERTESKSTSVDSSIQNTAEGIHQSKTWQAGDFISKTFEDVDIEAQVVIPDDVGNEIAIYTVVNSMLDTKQILEQEFPWVGTDSAVTQDGLWYMDGVIRIPDTQEETNGYISIGHGLSMKTEHWNGLLQVFPLIAASNGLEYEPDIVGDIDQEFSFEARDDAAGEAKDFLSKVYGKELQLLEAYSLSHEAFQKQYEAYGIPEAKYEDQMYEGSCETDDCYYFTFEGYFGQLPLLSNPYDYIVNWDSNAPVMKIHAGITSKGMEYASCQGDGAYDILEENSASLVSPDVILEAIRKKYELLIGDGGIIDEIKLIYFPIREAIIDDTHAQYKLVPAWQMRINKNRDNGTVKTTYFYIDATTGEEIIE